MIRRYRRSHMVLLRSPRLPAAWSSRIGFDSVWTVYLTPSRRQCPYGHWENHFRSYSTKSLVLKLRAHMRALTASKDKYKLKSPQHICVNLNIFVTVVPWSCMVFKNIPTRIKNSNSYILLIMPHIPAHQDAPTSQGTRPTPTVPLIAFVYAFRYVLSTI